jgi:AraC-like DNA-binding protein
MDSATRAGHSNLQPIVNSSRRHSLPPDPLSEVLQRWYLPDWRAGLAEFQAPWGITVPQGLAAFYVVLSGPCLLTCEKTETRSQLSVGDVLLLPHGSAHRLQDQPDSPAMSFPECFDSGGSRGERRRGLEPTTKLIYGCFSVERHVFQPVTGGLPPVIRLRADSFLALRGYSAIAQMVADEQVAAAPGWRAVVDRLVQILLVQTLRAFLVRDFSASDPACDADGMPWLAAALDEAIGPVLGLIHRRPEAAWTVTSLADHVNMSKSAFSERFREVVGKPPLQYLTEYRICKACQLLRDTRLGVKEISSQVGYDSASSFSNAFKRWMGKSPGAFRNCESRTGNPARH